MAMLRIAPEKRIAAKLAGENAMETSREDPVIFENGVAIFNDEGDTIL